jgi:hypothetical protein
MDEDECIRRYGLHPRVECLDEIRELLSLLTRREQRAQGAGDTELMKLCCAQLFNSGTMEDVLLIWGAKTASMDSDCSIDVQLLCGKGLTETKTYLASQRRPEAAAALRRLLHCEEAGDFLGFSVEERSAWYATYYGSDRH